MRLVLATCFFISLPLSWADPSTSAEKVRSDCIAREIQSCVAEQAQAMPDGADHTTNQSNPVCLSAAKRNEFQFSCVSEVNDFCAPFVPGNGLNPPEGCPGHNSSSALEEESPPSRV